MASEQHERQQRELEEIRRSFLDAGSRVGSFEPSHPNGNAPAEAPQAAAPAQVDRPLGRTAVVAVAIACLLLGGGFGYLLHRPAAPATPSVVSPPTATAAPQRPRVVAPPACLETARRGDQLLDMLLRNVRDQRMSLAFKAYTQASQACRKEASP